MFELQETSSGQNERALSQVAEKLKENFNQVPKSLFSAKVPAPFLRSDKSRPLHFTRDGLHLMYFTEAEFIKLNIKTSQIVQRRKLPRADLSPIFVDYKIWSQDDSKVMVFLKREISSSKKSEIYVYDIHAGQYTEVSQSINSHPNLNQGFDDKIFIECFNPLINHEIIIREVKKVQNLTQDGSRFDRHENL